MTNTDTELFELCNQVYGATKWGRMDNNSSTDEYYVGNPIRSRLNKPDVVEGWQIWRWEDFVDSGRLHYSLGKGQAYPLYNSDYLLDRPPNWVTLEKRGNKATFQYLAKCDTLRSWTGSEIEALSDTPLKALLLLTLNIINQGIDLGEKNNE